MKRPATADLAAHVATVSQWGQPRRAIICCRATVPSVLTETDTMRPARLRRQDEVRHPAMTVTTNSVAQRRMRNLRPWPKGVSGNPSGRPRAILEVVELARKHTTTAIAALARIAASKDAPPAAVVAASEALLNRAWGKPSQSVEVSGPSGGLIPIAELGTVARRQLLLELQARLLEATMVAADEQSSDSKNFAVQDGGGDAS